MLEMSFLQIYHAHFLDIWRAHEIYALACQHCNHKSLVFLELTIEEVNENRFEDSRKPSTPKGKAPSGSEQSTAGMNMIMKNRASIYAKEENQWHKHRSSLTW